MAIDLPVLFVVDKLIELDGLVNPDSPMEELAPLDPV
jgi:hypothetical protein